MISASFARTLNNLLGVAFIATGLALTAIAQVQTKTEIQGGSPTKQVDVQRGEVVYISGNDVVIKGDDGKIRDFPNVPESARVTVDGQQLSVHDLEPGMTIERTTITTTTPNVITTVKTVTGTVWAVVPPVSVILTLEDGKNQEFKIPAGTKFTVDGQPTDAFSLRPGMKVSATAVTEAPEDVVTEQVATTGEMPAFDPDVALLIVVTSFTPRTETANSAPEETAALAPAATPAPSDPASAPSQLPKTGSSLPLIGLAGGFFCILAFGLRARRAISSR